MNLAIRSLVASGALTATQARAAAMWSADLDAMNGAAPKTRPNPKSVARGAARPVNIMAAGVRGRLRAFESKAGGRSSKWYRIAYLALHMRHEVDAIAEMLEQEPIAVRGVVRLAGQALAAIYAPEAPQEGTVHSDPTRRDHASSSRASPRVR